MLIMEYEIMYKFPLLSASDDLKTWSGFICTEEQAFRLTLVAPQFPTSDRVYLETTHLNEKSTEYWQSILKKISGGKSESFLEYLELLENAITQTSTSNGVGVGCAILANPNFYSSVIDDIESVGPSKVTSLSRDFKEIVITQLDKSHREHHLKLSVPVGYPETKVLVSVELPFPDGFINWPPRIYEVSQVFQSYLEKCSRFWDDMGDLQSRIKVVDPIMPSKGHFHRRILLKDNVIINLIFNPLTPRSFPQISFSGPEKLVESFSAAIDNKCKIWDESLTVIQNLDMILDCEFISKECDEEDSNDEQSLCTVCYVYNFEDEIPDITCDCGAVFHRRCLYDLFVSDVSKTGLRRCIDCPNCQMEIRVPASFAATSW